MTFRAVPALFAAAVATSAPFTPACGSGNGLGEVPAAIPATDQRHFADPPVDAPRDRSARCADADLANMTVDDHVAYGRTVFTDQRGHDPDQPFPSNQELADQKRAEWSPVVNDAVPPGGDAAFTRDVCGLPRRHPLLRHSPTSRSWSRRRIRSTDLCIDRRARDPRSVGIS